MYFYLLLLLLPFLQWGCSSNQTPNPLNSPQVDLKKITLYTADQNPCSVELSISELEGFFKEEYNQFLSTLVRPGSLVFDVGAGSGLMTDIYLSCGAQVICIEPQPEYVYELESRFYNDDSVEVEPVALAEIESEMEIYQTVDSNALSSGSKWHIKKSSSPNDCYRCHRSLVVPVTTVDQMLCKYGIPDYCSIDVVNYELEVLKGLSRKIGIISFVCEADRFDALQDCISYLKALGYESFNFSVGDRGLFLSPQWVSAELLLQKITDKLQTFDFSEIGGLFGELFAI